MLKTMPLKKWELNFECFDRKHIVSLIIKFFIIISCSVCIYSTALHFSETARRQQYYEISKGVSESVLAYTRVCDAIIASDSIVRCAETASSSNSSMSYYAQQLQREISAVTAVSLIDTTQLAIFFSDSSLVVTPTQYYINRDFDTLFSTWYDNYLTYDLIHSGAQNICSTYYANGRCWFVWNVINEGTAIAHIILELDLPNMFSIPGNCIFFIGSDTEYIYSNVPETTNEQYTQLISSISENRTISISGKKYHAIKNVFSNVDLNIVACVPIRNGGLFALSAVLILASAAILALSFVKKRSPDTNDPPKKDQAYLEALGMGQIIQVMLTDKNAQTSDMAQKCLEIAGIDPKNGYFIIGIACVNDAFDIFGYYGGDDQTQQEYISPYFVLNNILSDTLLLNRHGTFGISNSYYIVLAERLNDERTEDIDVISANLSSLAEKYLGLTLMITESTFVQGTDMADALKLVVNKISHKTFWLSSAQEPAADSFSSSQNTYFILARKMRDCIDNKNYDKAQEIFEQIIDKHLPSDYEHLDIAKYRIYSIFDIILSITGCLSYQSSDLNSVLASINSIESCRTIGKQIFSDIIARQQAESTNTVNSLVPQIKEYTLNHYKEDTLNVSSIAAHFDMNMAYLSRTFKNETGMNLLEYIHRTRVDAAKELLPQYPAKDVSAMVGFGDIQSFVRTFKKYEGITPAEYKKIYS